MQIEFVRPDEIKMYLQKGAQLIDLRNREDYMINHIQNAISIPYDELEKRYQYLSKSKTYILYCERGATSLKAVRKMLKMGYRVKTLNGGFVAFSHMKKD